MKNLHPNLYTNDERTKEATLIFWNAIYGELFAWQSKISSVGEDAMPEAINSVSAGIGIENLTGLVVLLGAIIVAVITHALLFKLLRRLASRSGKEQWRHLVEKIRPVVRIGLIIVAIELTLPVVDMPERLERVISQITSLCIIGVVGWVAFTVVSVLTEFSISHYRVDVEDNLAARKMRTRLRVLRQAMSMIIFLVTIAAMLMIFPGARSIGVSLFASAGVAGIVVGFAARPVLSNLLAGIQIALTQPIRIDDAVVIEGEWGWIEEITSTYVVVKLWDWRRLIVPLSHFIEKPFQNWTRESAAIIGAVTWFTDYTAPIAEMREKLKEFLGQSKFWDGNVQVLQIVDTGKETIELRALMSAKNSPTAFDLRCEIREKMILWLQTEYPGALPRSRVQLQMDQRQPTEPPQPMHHDEETAELSDQIDHPEDNPKPPV
jgi:small-conductance mechanosensitive channel